LAGTGVVLAVSCFCAVMWALLIRANLSRPALPNSPPDYGALLAPGETERVEQWGIYLGPQRVGGSTMRIAREGDGAISIATEVRADLGQAARYMVGSAGPFKVELHAEVSPLRGLRSWEVNSEALDARVLGVVRGDRMLIRGRLRGRTVKTDLPYEPGRLISEAFSPLTAMPPLDERQVGRSWSMAVLNPVTGDIQDVTVHVVRSLEVRIGGEPVRVFQLDFEVPNGKWPSWVTGQGRVLMQGTPFGLTLRREDLPAQVLRVLTEAPPPSAEKP
jgi:hypothetical protein